MRQSSFMGLVQAGAVTSKQELVAGVETPKDGFATVPTAHDERYTLTHSMGGGWVRQWVLVPALRFVPCAGLQTARAWPITYCPTHPDFDMLICCDFKEVIPAIFDLFWGGRRQALCGAVHMRGQEEGLPWLVFICPGADRVLLISVWAQLRAEASSSLTLALVFSLHNMQPMLLRPLSSCRHNHMVVSQQAPTAAEGTRQD